ncbi:GTPase IMAP family member 8-like isoform X1 [Onychostoma macrolepis]|uniref:GTPase IMAP family member 8-like isoform X1 n=1 Tax=Onychostoma macrolepis TaxID=369639 RepID=UPI00272BBE56|nr:GTPase IMAP family member 8-like isoform X1 [Onychostoma macrolepis]
MSSSSASPETAGYLYSWTFYCICEVFIRSAAEAGSATVGLFSWLPTIPVLGRQSQAALDIFKMEQIKGLNVVLLGKTGAGKSSTGNTILGRDAFVSKKSSRSVTRDVAVESGSVGVIPLTVYDTPGLFDTDMNEEEIQKKYKEVLQRCESGPCMFLLVIKADRFTEEERKTVEKIEEMLGGERLKKTWILFTRGDELEEENMTIQEFINETEPVKNLVQKYDQRYHVFNNKTKDQDGQVQGLFIKIFKPFMNNLGEDLETLKQNPLKRKIPQEIEPDAPADSLPSRRLVLLGKSGVGKSAAGNTILGQREFNSVMSTSSVTRKCSEAHATLSGRSVSVVDTPGFFDTKMKQEELMMEIARSVYISSPGPHAFLIVLRVTDRFTDQEQQIPQMIEMMFGQEVLKYSFILFTHGDLLEDKSVEKLIEQNSRLRDLVQKCGDRYHVYNNKDLNNREQVNDLLQKIDSMIEQNGGGHYSNQMFEDALRFRREEEEQKQRDEEQRKQQEEKQRQVEIERVKKETDERVRAEYEVRFERERAGRQRDEEQRKQQEEKNRQDQEKQGGFKQFFSKYGIYFVIGGIILGGAIGAGIGAAIGAAIEAGGGALVAFLCNKFS